MKKKINSKIPQINPSIFKAYDVRGIYPKDLNERNIYLIGRAFASWLSPRTIVIGRDIRTSSLSLFESLAKGIIDQGVDVIDIGLSSTDMFYFSVNHLGTDGGIMITASHNPKEWNGLKFVRTRAIPINEDSGLKEIKNLALNASFKRPSRQGQIIQRNILNEFISFVLSFVDVSKIKPLKLVLDASNGMAALVCPEIFKKIKCELTKLNFRLDGTFPGHEPNPLIEELRIQIIQKVIEKKSDLGVIWDGDADRCFFIDEDGKFIPGDFILGLLSQKILENYSNSTILYDVRSSKYVKNTIEKLNGKPQICRVGHSFMKEDMRRYNAQFGGEISGHYYYKINDFYSDNGFIPMLQILELISEKNKKLSELLEGTKNYFISGEINSHVSDKTKKINELLEIYKDAKNISKLDGITIEYDDWWFNVRPSNTEDLLRLNLEANTKELMEQKRDEVLKIIRS